MNHGKFLLEMRLISIMQNINGILFYELYYRQKMTVREIWEEMEPDCVGCYLTKDNLN